MAMMTFALIVTTINLILLSVLLIIYVKNYLNIKAQFNLGLVAFAVFLVVQKIISIVLFLSMMSEPDKLGTAIFILEIFEMLGFSTLLVITLK